MLDRARPETPLETGAFSNLPLASPNRAGAGGRMTPRQNFRALNLFVVTPNAPRAQVRGACAGVASALFSLPASDQRKTPATTKTIADRRTSAMTAAFPHERAFHGLAIGDFGRMLGTRGTWGSKSTVASQAKVMVMPEISYRRNSSVPESAKACLFMGLELSVLSPPREAPKCAGPQSGERQRAGLGLYSFPQRLVCRLLNAVDRSIWPETCDAHMCRLSP